MAIHYSLLRLFKRPDQFAVRIAAFLYALHHSTRSQAPPVAINFRLLAALGISEFDEVITNISRPVGDKANEGSPVLGH